VSFIFSTKIISKPYFSSQMHFRVKRSRNIFSDETQRVPKKIFASVEINYLKFARVL
jgi:hypothetical protein